MIESGWLDLKWQLLWDRFIVPVDDPGSRLFHVNIISTIILILVFYYLKGTRKPQEIWYRLKKDVFNRKYWWNRSAKQDYKIYFLNALLKVFLFIPFLDISFFVATKTTRTLLSWNSGEFFGAEARTLSVAAFTVFAFIFDDFVRFYVHWISHKFPIVWKMHQTHHSARVLTPLTLFRSHPVESAVSTLRNALVMGFCTGLFIFIFEAPMSVFTLLGVNMFGFIFNLLGSNLRHSQLPLEFGILERVFISPRMHQIHHSTKRKHWDKNMGVSLSVWDQMFGTCIFSKDVKGEKLRFGL